MLKAASNRDKLAKDKSQSPPRGRRQHRAAHRANGLTRRARRALGPETEGDRVCRDKGDRRTTEGHSFGMGAGIARKPGNAGGVKAPTAVDRERRNICYTQR